MVLVSLYALLALVASLQSIISTHYSPKPGWPTNYNNYVIFKSSFDNLIANNNLYLAYPEIYFDLFKYSPSFPVFMLPFSFLPDWLGLTLWNLFNALVLVFALLKSPVIPTEYRAAAIWLLTIETLTSLQNSQSNALIAGLILWAFYLIDKQNFSVATLLLMIGVFIKPFCLIGFLLFLFYPGKLKAIAWSVLWLFMLTLLPLLFITPDQLAQQYENWGVLLAWDQGVSIGLSVQGWLQTWFNWLPSKNAILGVGAALLFLPFVNFRNFNKPAFRYLYLAALLIWMVIFNHKAESPTFVIAFSGILIWYYNTSRTLFSISVLICSFLLTSLSPTDLFPAVIRENAIKPYVLKAVPCIFVFGLLIYQLTFINFRIVHVNKSNHS
jgi:hypothetical protein